MTLVVPMECVLVAYDLIRDYEVEADVLPYLIDERGQVIFEWPRR